MPELEEKFEPIDVPQPPPGSGIPGRAIHTRTAMISKDELSKYLHERGNHSKVQLVDTILPVDH